MSGTTPGIFRAGPHPLLPTSPGGRCHHPHCADEYSEAASVWVTCTRSLEHLVSTNLSGLKSPVGPPTLAHTGLQRPGSVPFLWPQALHSQVRTFAYSLSSAQEALVPPPSILPRPYQRWLLSQVSRRLLAASHLCLSHILLRMSQSLPDSGALWVLCVRGMFNVVKTHWWRDLAQNVLHV